MNPTAQTTMTTTTTEKTMENLNKVNTRCVCLFKAFPSNHPSAFSLLSSGHTVGGHTPLWPRGQRPIQTRATPASTQDALPHASLWGHVQEPRRPYAELVAWARGAANHWGSGQQGLKPRLLFSTCPFPCKGCTRGRWALSSPFGSGLERALFHLCGYVSIE